ncbi:MAG: gliding motility-associated C-terminal domain-containing protein [Chitinophagales bacterium]|nr:gliding motility-associated C-terminal domain-containing protein [Chitinophagales bacterium]
MNLKGVYLYLFCLSFLFFSGVSLLQAQVFNDGPIELQVRLRDVNIGFNETDVSVLGVGFAPDEPRIRVWARDNADLDGQGWLGGTCHGFAMGTGGANGGLPSVTPPINETLLNYTYPTATVPQYFDIRVLAFEDDIPVDGLAGICTGGPACTYTSTQCCGVIVFGTCVGLNEGDDRLCDQDPFATNINYRLGPPCQWYDHGYITNGTCGNNWRPGIESYWRYTKGTSCANAIDLGTINPGGILTHFNSNQCYSNTHTASPGNDVWYKFHANGPIGITASLCGVNGAQFDSYLYLYSACGQVTPDTANDDGCGTQSSLAYSICQAGDYYLVVDGKTASDQGTFTLTITENPNFVFGVTLNKTDVSCAGGSDGQITAVVQGGTPPFTYTWNPSTLSGSQVSGLSAGAYSITVTDSKGCQASASTQINVPAPLTVTTTGNPVTCGGACDGSATANPLGGTSPYNYAWNSLPPQQLQTATYLCPGNYIVTVTDNKGCTASATVNVPNTITINIQLDSLKNVRCYGAANGAIYLTSTGGQQPFTFAWSNGGVTTEDNLNLGPGTYTITVTDQIGCTAGATYTITEPPLLTCSVSFTFNPRCHNSSDGIVNTVVNGGVQPYSYQWSGPVSPTTPNLNNVPAGNYSVTVSDANGCTITASASLTAPPPFSVSLSQNGVLCYGASNGSASVTVSGATPPYTYLWSDFTTSSSTNGLQGGPFTVWIEDNNGCDTVLTGNITEPSPIQIQITSTEPQCANQGSGQITASVTGGTPSYTYSWSGGLAPVPNPTAGSGNYTLTITDANGCTATGAVAVNTPDPFTVTVIGINPNCIGDSTGAATVSSTGGVGPFTYSWNNNSTNAYLEKLPKGFYSVTVTDANGCTATGQVTLSDPAVDPQNCKADKYVVLIPTAFTPNGDNVNDRLVAIMRNVQKLEMRVYNRWGELVYENTNMTPGEGWDGTFRGIAQPVGTYVYTYRVTYINGVIAEDKGSATLLR